VTFLHAFLFAVDTKYRSLAIDARPAYVSKVVRSVLKDLNLALNNNPEWVTFVQTHTIPVLEEFKENITREIIKGPIHMAIVKDLLEQKYKLHIITWTKRTASGLFDISPFDVERIQHPLFIFLVEITNDRWEPIVTLMEDKKTISENAGLFDTDDYIVVTVLKHIRDSQQTQDTALELNIPSNVTEWYTDILNESDVVFTDEFIGEYDITTQKDIDLSDLSGEQLEANILQLLSSNDPFTKSRARAFCALVKETLEDVGKKTSDKAIGGTETGAITAILPVIDATLNNIDNDSYLETRYGISVAAETFIMKQQRKLRAQVPFQTQNASWTAPHNMDAFISENENENEKRVRVRVRLMGPVSCWGLTFYRGDDVSICGLYTGGTPSIHKEVKSVKLIDYMNMIKSLQKKDNVIVHFQTPYYETNSVLVIGPIKATVVSNDQDYVQLHMDRSLCKRDEHIRSNVLFYKIWGKNDALIFREDSYDSFPIQFKSRVGCIHSSPLFVDIRTGTKPRIGTRAEEEELKPNMELALNIMWPTMQEWIYLNRNTISKCINLIQVGNLLSRYMGWSVTKVNALDMALLLDIMKESIYGAVPDFARDMEPQTTGHVQPSKYKQIMESYISGVKTIYDNKGFVTTKKGDPLLDVRVVSELHKKMDVGALLWLDLLRKYIEKECEDTSKTEKAASTLRQISRDLERMRPIVEELKKKFELKKTNIEYMREYPTINDMFVDQDKRINEWEGKYALVEAGDQVYKRINHIWMKLGEWSNEGTLSLLPIIMTVHLPGWTPLEDARTLLTQREDIKTIQKQSNYEEMCNTLREYLDNSPKLKDEISRVQSQYSVEIKGKTYLQSFFINEIIKTIDIHDVDADIFDSEEQYIIDENTMIESYSEWKTDRGYATPLDFNSGIIGYLSETAGVTEHITDYDRDSIKNIIGPITYNILVAKYKSLFPGKPVPKPILHKDMFPDNPDKGSQFEMQETIVVIAAFFSLLLQIIPEIIVVQSTRGDLPCILASFNDEDVIAYVACLIHKQYDNYFINPRDLDYIVKSITKFRQLIMKIRPIYASRLTSVGSKTIVAPSEVSEKVTIKPNRFRPPLAPVTDRMARSNIVGAYLQSLYQHFSKTKPMKVVTATSGVKKALTLNSCCLERVTPGINYYTNMNEALKENAKAVVEATSTVMSASTEAAISAATSQTIHMYTREKARPDDFLKSVLRMPNARILTYTTIEAAPIATSQHLFEDILRANLFLAEDNVLSPPLNINQVSTTLESILEEQASIIKSLCIPYAGVFPVDLIPKLRSYFIELNPALTQNDGNRMLRGIDQFMKYDMRRMIGQACYNGKLPGARPEVVELIFINSMSAIKPIHINISDVTQTIYLYNYIIIRVMVLLLWSLTQTNRIVTKESVIHAIKSSENPIMNAITTGLMTITRAETTRAIGAFFVELWTAYIRCIDNAMTNFDALKKAAETLRENDKMRKMKLSAMMTNEEKDAYDKLKAIGIKIDNARLLDAATAEEEISQGGATLQSIADINRIIYDNPPQEDEMAGQRDTDIPQGATHFIEGDVRGEDDD
jgi:hypothetical protein